MRVNGRDLMRDVAKKHGIATSALVSGNKARAYAWPRQEAMYELFTQCPHLSLPAIASIVGVSDHTTVRHGIAAHAERAGLPTPLMGTRSVRGWASLCAAYEQAMRKAA